MNVLEMFKEWLTVEKGVKLVPDELSNNPNGYIGTVTNEDAFLVRILVDDKKALMLIFKDNGVVHLYIMDKDASLDEYKRFIDVANIWLEMNEFSYKLLLTFSDGGRLPRLLSKLSDGSLKELEGDKFVAMLKKLDDKAKIESHAEVVEYELGGFIT